MDFLISATTDIGISKHVNQDGVFAAKVKTKTGNMAFAVVCDGMGGLSYGEIASASLIHAFMEWFHKEFPRLSQEKIFDDEIIRQWTVIVKTVNDKLRLYGMQNKCMLGSTVTALLLTDYRYFLLNVGDTRAYQLKNDTTQLTVDHTLIEHQIKLGNMTREQGKSSSMRNVITRCVGVAANVYPDFFFGPVMKNAVYMLCTDGFRHKITDREILDYLYMRIADDHLSMKKMGEQLIKLNKQRKEKDDISVITIFTEQTGSIS